MGVGVKNEDMRICGLHLSAVFGFAAAGNVDCQAIQRDEKAEGGEGGG